MVVQKCNRLNTKFFTLGLYSNWRERQGNLAGWRRRESLNTTQSFYNFFVITFLVKVKHPFNKIGVFHTISQKYKSHLRLLNKMGFIFCVY